MSSTTRRRMAALDDHVKEVEEESSLSAELRIHFDTRLLEELLSPDDDNNNNNTQNNNNNDDDVIRTILQTTLPSAAALWSRHLRVRRHHCSSRPLSTNTTTGTSSSCLRHYHPNDYPDDADLVIIVAGDHVHQRCRPRQLAYASVCARSPLDNRPTVGKLEFCLSNFVQQQQQALSPMLNHVSLLQEYQQHLPHFVGQESHLNLDPIAITAHELAHILGMGNVHYPYYYQRQTASFPNQNDGDNTSTTTSNSTVSPPVQRQSAPALQRLCGNGKMADPDRDGPLPLESTIQVMQTHPSGRWEHYLVTPRVTTVARNHFGCPTLIGARLQDERGSCWGSHWHERWFYNHLLSPAWSTSSTNVVTHLTLAALEDSGWYRVNYSGIPAATTAPAFGLAAGCDFVESDCIRNDTAVVAEFCHEPVARWSKRRDPEFFPEHHAYCDPGHVAWTACDLVVHTDGYNNKKLASAKKTTTTYFSNPKLAPVRFPLADHCPIPDLGLGLDCRRSSSYQPFYPGEQVGPDSRCFNALYDDDSPMANNESVGRRRRHRPACLQVTCDPVQGALVHHPTEDGSMVPQPCRFSGEIIAFHGFNSNSNSNSNNSFIAANAERAVFVCPRLAVLCPELYTCPDACWGRGECVYPERMMNTAETTTTATIAVQQQRPYCRCFDTTNPDPACAPSYAGHTASLVRSSTPLTTAMTTTTRVPQPPFIRAWEDDSHLGWMAPIWITLLLFVAGTVRQLQRRGITIVGSSSSSSIGRRRGLMDHRE